MKKIILLLIAAGLMLSACSQIKQGEVYSKEYSPGHYEAYTTSESVRVRGEYFHIPVEKVRWCPERYAVYIRKETDKGKFETAQYTVSREEYESIHIGDEISFE